MARGGCSACAESDGLRPCEDCRTEWARLPWRCRLGWHRWIYPPWEFPFCYGCAKPRLKPW